MKQEETVQEVPARNPVLDKYAMRDAKWREKQRNEARTVAGEEITKLEREVERLAAENAELKAKIAELESDEGETQIPPETPAEASAPEASTSTSESAETPTEPKKAAKKGK